MALILRSISNARSASIRSVDNTGLRFSEFYNDISMNGFRITNLGDPIDPQDAVTKSYLDIRDSGLDPKESSTFATVANITNFSNQATVQNALDLVGAVAPVIALDNRVLVKNQIDDKLNGIYRWDGATLVRSDDMNGIPPENVSGGAYTFIEQGDTLANNGFVLQGKGVLTLGVDSLVWVKFSSTVTTLASLGGTPWVGTGTGPNLTIKGIIGGTNISLSSNATTVTVNNTMANTTLSSAGGSPLPVDSVGPTLSVRGLTASGAVNLTSNASTIDLGVPGLSSAGGSTLVNNSTNMVLKGLIGGTNVTLAAGANDITINASIPAVAPSFGLVSYSTNAGVDGAVVPGGGATTLVIMNSTIGSASNTSLGGSGMVLSKTGRWVVTGKCGGSDTPNPFEIGLYQNGLLINHVTVAENDVSSSSQSAVKAFVNVVGSATMTVRVRFTNGGNLGRAVAFNTNRFASIEAFLLE